MTNVDQFESVFRAAAKEIYVPRPVALRRVLCLHDLDVPELDAFEAGVSFWRFWEKRPTGLSFLLRSSPTSMHFSSRWRSGAPI